MIQDRVVTVYGPITADVETRVLNSLAKVVSQPRSAVTILINSPGGGVVSGVKIRSAIAQLPIPTEGIVYKMACSAGFMILQHCSWRCARPDATLMFHAPTLSPWRVDEPTYDQALKGFRDLFELELQHNSRRSGQSVDQWRKWAREERKFTAEEALSLGIIDAIYYRVPYL